MIRLAVAISRTQFISNLIKEFGDSPDKINLLLIQYNLKEDLKVSFGTDVFKNGVNSENEEPKGLLGIVSLGNGLTFWGMKAGASYEFPVYFLVYWDGKRNRAYIPTKGNPWNTDTRKAYGNNNTLDLRNAFPRWPVVTNSAGFDLSSLRYHAGNIYQDVIDRLVISPS